MKKSSLNTLKGIRIALACVFLFGITLMLCDRTDLTHAYLSWMAQLQIFPALLSLFAGLTLVSVLVCVCVFVSVLVLGRLYCSVICPLGIMQDVAYRLSHLGKHKNKSYLHRDHPVTTTYAKAQQITRWTIFGLFAILCCLPATASLAHLIAPYSLYARTIYTAMAAIYAVPGASLTTAILFGLLLLFILVMACLDGRWWCNTICPVGTGLSCISRHAVYRFNIHEEDCINCGLCAKRCRAHAIDAKNHTIDAALCVDCFDCLSNCSKHAIHYERSCQGAAKESASSRRQFLTVAGAMAATAVVKAQHKTTDGGLAVLEDKKVPNRTIPVLPAGAISARHMQQFCTGCQLCVSACPQGILRPSTDITRLMQPEMDFNQGYCLTSCTRCADVCPAHAITRITKEEKTAIRRGQAYWIADNCVMLTDHVSCGNCARHCPTGAITVLENGIHVDAERCIGCGHCEYVCPARPFSAIYVEGLDQHIQQ